MTDETIDQSTEREWATSASPHTRTADETTHRRHPENYRVLDHAIKFLTPDGIKTVHAPSDWGLHDIAAVRHIAELMGYAQTTPDEDSMFVFAPKVHADEVADTPLDLDARTLPSRLTLIPGTRTYEVHETPTGYAARLYDYASQREYSLRVDGVQAELKGV